MCLWPGNLGCDERRDLVVGENEAGHKQRGLMKVMTMMEKGGLVRVQEAVCCLQTLGPRAGVETCAIH